MRRDMHLLRQIVLAVSNGTAADLPKDDITEQHIALAVDQALLSGRGVSVNFGATRYAVGSLQLTPAGHDFAALAGSDAIWAAVAQRVAERAGDTSFALWLGLLEAEARRALYAD